MSEKEEAQQEMEKILHGMTDNELKYLVAKILEEQIRRLK